MPPFGVLVRLLKDVFLDNIIEYCHVVKNVISSISHVHYPRPSTAPNRHYIYCGRIPSDSTTRVDDLGGKARY